MLLLTGCAQFHPDPYVNEGIARGVLSGLKHIK